MGYRDKFRIFEEYKNTMKVFVYFGISIAKTDVFIDISHTVT